MRHRHLIEFIQLVDELNDLRLAKKVLSFDSIIMQLKDRSKVDILNFDEEDCRSFILSCRLLVQDNDKISIRCIDKIVSSGDYPEDGQQAISNERCRLNLSLDSYCAISAPGCNEEITHRDVFETFLWGSYAHRCMDSELRAQYLDWNAEPRQYFALKLDFLLMLKILLESASRISQLLHDMILDKETEQGAAGNPLPAD